MIWEFPSEVPVASKILVAEICRELDGSDKVKRLNLWRPIYAEFLGIKELGINPSTFPILNNIRMCVSMVKQQLNIEFLVVILNGTLSTYFETKEYDILQRHEDGE